MFHLPFSHGSVLTFCISSLVDNEVPPLIAPNDCLIPRPVFFVMLGRMSTTLGVDWALMINTCTCNGMKIHGWNVEETSLRPNEVARFSGHLTDPQPSVFHSVAHKYDT